MSLAISCRLLGAKLNNVYVLGGYASRNMATIDDYKIKWKRPEVIPIIDPRQSGDLGLDITVKPTDLRLHCEKSKELQDADESVRKLFTLAFHPKRETNRVMRSKIIALVQRHVCDKGSVEVQIARLTSAIHNLQDYVKEQPRNGHARSILKLLIEKRGKYLRHLRTWDYPRYEWVLEKLNLVNKSLPLSPGSVSRKESLTKLTKKYCDNIIKKKFENFKVELKEEQKKFYAEKAEKLAFILKEEKECGLTPTVTEEEIEMARKKVELLNLPERSQEIE